MVIDSNMRADLWKRRQLHPRDMNAAIISNVVSNKFVACSFDMGCNWATLYL